MFLLEHSAEVPELWIHSEAEYRLYSELKRAVNDTAINDSENTLGFSVGEYFLSFEAGVILLSKGKSIVGKYDITDYVKSPRSILHRIQSAIDETNES